MRPRTIAAVVLFALGLSLALQGVLTLISAPALDNTLPFSALLPPGRRRPRTPRWRHARRAPPPRLSAPSGASRRSGRAPTARPAR